MFGGTRFFTLAVLAAGSGAMAADRPAAPKPVRVAVYTDAGVSRGLDALVEQLTARADLKVERVTAADIRAGKALCFSPHLEEREDTRSLLHRAIRWVAENP